MNRGRGGSRAAHPAPGAHQAAPAGPGPGLPAAPTGKWLFRGGDGRLTAYACAARGLLRWTEAAYPATGWTGPEVLSVPGWTGAAAMAQSHEGYIHFVTLRTPADGSGRPEIAVATQFQSGRGLTDWRGLGAPGVRGGPEGDAPVCPPRIVVNQRSGTVHVIVSLRLGGIVRRSRNAQGTWGGWKQIAPDPYPGGITAVMPAGGRLEVLASGPAGIDRWVGSAQGQFHLADRVATQMAGVPAGCETGPRRATYFWRYPGDDSLVAWRAGQPGVQSGMIGLGGAGGRGAPGVGRAVIGGYDCTVLAQNGGEGDIELTAYVSENEGYGTWWAGLGGRGLRAPQVAVDAAGRIVVAALDRDGALAVTRQDTAAEGLVFGPWQRA
ncbi:hypothetical protein ACFWUW_04655 [Streptomyces sp. NPDC058655]|uniref:hypothetical protein n=1 Tax=unclassified Streptomyces TaxID=2593676 RepID=UPI00364B85E2